MEVSGERFRQMSLTINGEIKEIKAVSHVADLLAELGLDPRAVVVELNEKIVRRDAIEQTPVNDGDRIEILRFVGGG
jgi:thiamine biosynthesis protein ThiS